MARDPKYGADHRRLRAQWKQRIANGEHPPCPRCGHPVETLDFHLDHDDDGINYLGPAHADCNTLAASEKSKRIRKARRETPNRPRSQDW